MSDVFAPLRDGATEECLSDLTLDRLRSGELTADERARAELHLKACGRCQRQRLALQATVVEEEQLALLAARAQGAARARGDVGPEVVARREASNVVRIGRILAPVLIAASVTAVVVTRLWTPAEPTVQPKGGDSLALVVKRRDGTIERLSEGARLLAGDQVRFSLDLAAAAFVVVLSLDGEGKVSLFTPEPVALGEGAEQLLDTTVELDASRGAERFVAVLCDRRTRTTDLMSSAERALRQASGRPEHVASIDSGCRETSVLVHRQD